ncbi:DUF3343 domain-containing protein [Natranaerobius thermophilus]|uniref:Putative Se/S carrier protein-like domain-containing protein n=1 Tax=Natranaerobius thermophilus (strain ATCC BAA-1301 / DSM 18059 / JW/NM-WN-LF) TaxID=457570 RepID=B2A0Q9_NATTJ|nr:DUF3343 domain-containing protein [Natranaerobius thermophilus]ACB85939.1 conserved hypothetical protein [Natranaerobius thermophilus JW/NM-WN-LF]
MYYVITFPSTHMAMKFEKIVFQNKLTGKLIPIPRELSANCGLCARLESEQDLKTAINTCQKEQIQFEQVYRLDSQGETAPEPIDQINQI